MMSEFFKFEDASRDFPFYRHNPRLSKAAWFILLLSIPVAFMAYAIVGLEGELIGSFLFALIPLIPLLIFSGGDISLILRKPTKKEIMLAIMLFIGYMIYAVVVGEVIDYIFQTPTNPSDYFDVNWEMTIALVFSMLGEEFLKLIPFLFFMRVIFKYTNNRKLAIVISTVIILVFFGLLHYEPGITPLVSVLVIQGLGTIFEMYGYIKTKNLFVPYLSHLLTDAVIFIMIILLG